METLARNGLKICMIDSKFSLCDNTGLLKTIPLTLISSGQKVGNSFKESSQSNLRANFFLKSYLNYVKFLISELDYLLQNVFDSFS